MPERFTVDTNVLISSVDIASPAKHERAVELMARALHSDCVLMLQSLAEFYHAVTRKRLMTRSDASSLVERWMDVFPTASYSDGALRAALGGAVKRRSGLWDMLLVEAAREAGCRYLLSEDLQDGTDLDGLVSRNPFLGRILPPDLAEALGLE